MPPASSDLTWVGDWVGIPYKEQGRSREGMDCLGLFVALHKARRDVDIPDPVASVATAVARKLTDRYKHLYRPVREPQEGDVVLLRYDGYPTHIGYHLGLRNMMIHAHPALGTVVERTDSLTWKNRVEGFYRYVG